MKRMKYLVTCATIDENGTYVYFGVIGIFSSIKKALAAANNDITEIGAPKQYLLNEHNTRSIISVDTDGKYANENKDIAYGLEYVIYGLKMNLVCRSNADPENPISERLPQ